MPQPMRVLPLLALLAAPLGAQVRLGLLAGGVSANITTTATADFPNKSSRTGFLVGISATAPLGKRFSFGPELSYVTKGVKAKAVPQNVSEEVKLAYFEVPLLLRANFGTGAIRPWLIAGPSIAFKSGCKLRLQTTNPGSDTTFNCKDIDADVASSDISAMVGAGIAFHRLGFSVRYDVGLKNINTKNGATDVVKNRTWMGVVSVSM